MLGAGDRLATATIETETERDKDSTAVRERVKNQQQQEEEAIYTGEEAEKLYRGLASYSDFLPKGDKSGNVFMYYVLLLHTILLHFIPFLP